MNHPMILSVPRLINPTADGVFWDKPPWHEVFAETVGHFMGKRPAHAVETRFKIAYDTTAITLLFRVTDCFIRATATGHQQPVCRDSCVEWFFTPGDDPAAGYFNIEVNCGGWMLFHFHPHGTRIPHIEIPAADCDALAPSHSLPRTVDPEQPGPIVWTVGYSIPFALLGRYCPVSTPQPGTVWRANFYKCADQTSQPHWLTWAPVAAPQPDFHRPDAFGTLLFR